MTPEQFRAKLASLQVHVANAINRDIPIIAGNEAARLFRQNFRDEGFFGKKWQEVNRRKSREVSYTTKKRGVAKTKTVGPAKGSDGRRTRIPQRQFMGDSPELQEAIRNMIDQHMQKLLNHDQRHINPYRRKAECNGSRCDLLYSLRFVRSLR